MDKFRRYDLYCLGRLQKNDWICEKRHEANTMSKKLGYKINRDGIYAVIFLPSMENSLYRDEVYCGYLCENLKFTIYILILLVPTIIYLIYSLHLMYE